MSKDYPRIFQLWGGCDSSFRLYAAPYNIIYDGRLLEDSHLHKRNVSDNRQFAAHAIQVQKIEDFWATKIKINEMLSVSKLFRFKNHRF